MIRLLVFSLLICGVAEGISYSSSRPSSKSYSSSRSSPSSSVRPSSFSSGKSYSSGKSSSNPTSSKSFDSSAASAQKAQQGKASYTSYKEARSPKYRSSDVEYTTRTDRQRVVFNNYYNTRPTVIYRDNSWNPLFWMWLMDHRDRQAEWVYHHRAELSEERYRDLLAQNVNLESQLKDLENQKIARDPNYAPKDVDKDLMYTNDNAAPEKDYTWVAVTVIVVAFLILVGGFYQMCRKTPPFRAGI